jgi:hypothetical protein
MGPSLCLSLAQCHCHCAEGTGPLNNCVLEAALGGFLCQVITAKLGIGRSLKVWVRLLLYTWRN